MEASPTPSSSSRPPTSASGMFYQEESKKAARRKRGTTRVTDVACFPVSSLDEDDGGGEDHDDVFVDGYGVVWQLNGRLPNQ